MTTRLIISLSHWSGLSVPDVEHIVATAPRRYKVFSIPKRNGGLREIAQPSRELKVLQNLVVRRILHLLPLHDAAHGYVKGRGIKSNAAAHVSSHYLLKLDLQDFFPSIRPHDLTKHLRAYAPDLLSAEEVMQVRDIVFWKPKGDRTSRLCIGAPSSPFLSNTLMIDLDTSLAGFAAELGVTYTRYADDMAFSCMEKDVLPKIQQMATAAIEASLSPRLRVNYEKTVHISRAHRRMLTGIVLNAVGEISIGRERKRVIRSMVHRQSLGQLSELQVLELQGLLAFAHDIEPVFAAKMRADQPA